MKRSYRTVHIGKKKKKKMWHCVLKERHIWRVNLRYNLLIQESRLGCPLETFSCVLHFSNQILDTIQTNLSFSRYMDVLFPTIILLSQISLSELNIKSKFMLQHCSCRLIQSHIYCLCGIVLSAKALFHFKIISWLPS